MQIRTIFFNESGRVRSGWRVLFFVALYSAGLALFAALVYTLAGLTVGLPTSSSEKFFFGTLVSLVPALAVGWLCGYLFEALPFRVLGASFTRHWSLHLGLGLLVGALSVTFAVAVATIFGNYSFTLTDDLDTSAAVVSLGWTLAVFACGAAFEEALFRGYAFQTLVRAQLAWLAVLLTAIIFGAAHLSNRGAGWISSVDTVLAGIVFAAAYFKSRDLWFPFGIHLMWNWVQGSIFGVEVSGISDLTADSIFKEIDNGPDWLTGGAYGIEGGIASTIALMLTIAAIYCMPWVRPDNELMAMCIEEDPKASVS